MINFKEELVINAFHKEKAEVGKMYYYSDNLLKLKENVEKNNDYKGELTSVDFYKICPFYLNNEIYAWQFLYPYEEPPKQRMTRIQFMEWVSKGNGMYKYKNRSRNCYAYESCLEEKLNDEVEEDIVIRTWDSDEWIEPTVDIYERDCKGGK